MNNFILIIMSVITTFFILHILLLIKLIKSREKRNESEASMISFGSSKYGNLGFFGTIFFGSFLILMPWLGIALYQYNLFIFCSSFLVSELLFFISSFLNISYYDSKLHYTKIKIILTYFFVVALLFLWFIVWIVFLFIILILFVFIRFEPQT